MPPTTPSVEQLRAELDEALGAASSGPGRARLKRRLVGRARRLPLWATDRQRQRVAEALRLNEEPARDELGPGEALGVIVLDRPGEARVVRLRVHRVEAEVEAPLPRPEAISAVSWDSLLRAADLAVRLYPFYTPLSPRLDLSLEVRDLAGRPLRTSRPLEGGSLGAAALVATWSLLMEQPLRPGLVVTGALSSTDLVSDSALLAVSRLGDKQREVARAGWTLVGPSEAGTVDELLRLAFPPAGGDLVSRCPEPRGYDPALALELEDRRYRTNGDGLRWSELGARFERLARAPRLPEVLRPLALARAGACWTHCDEPDRAEPLLREAIEVIEQSSPADVPAQVEVVTRTHLAVLCHDHHQLDEAAAQAERAARMADELRLPVDGINAWSTLGQVRRSQGRHQEALALALRARDFYDHRGSSECPRNHTYVVVALVRLGRWDEAEREWALGCRHNLERALPGRRRLNRAFLDQARLEGALVRLRRAPEPADWSWPRLLEEAEAALERAWPAAGAGAAAETPELWPAPALRRQRETARLRVADGDEERRSIAEAALRRAEDERDRGRPSSAWQSAQVALEASLLEAGPAWIDAALTFAPTAAARADGSREAILELLEGDLSD